MPAMAWGFDSLRVHHFRLAIRSVSLIVSMGCLVEFARRSWEPGGSQLAGPWALFLLIGPSLVAVFFNYDLADAFSRSFSGVVAGTWALRVFVRGGGHDAHPRYLLILIGAILELLLLLTGVVLLAVPAVTGMAVGPLRFLNFEFPVYMVEMALSGLLLLAMLASVLEQPRDAVVARQWPRWLVIFWAVASLLICVETWGMLRVTGNYGDSERRASLLGRVQTGAFMLDRAALGTLTGTAADVDRPAYRAIREALHDLKVSVADARFAYLLARKDGDIVFLADSEPDNSPDYSPPGQVYDEAGEGLKRLFTRGDGLVEGPIRDRWGAWVSALTAMKGGGKTIAVLGMDVDAAAWGRTLIFHRLTGVAVAFMLSILCGALLAGLHLGRESSMRVDLSESRFQAFFARSPEMAIAFDAAGAVVAVNRRTCDLTGYAPEDLLGCRVDDLPFCDALGKTTLTEDPVDGEAVVSVRARDARDGAVADANPAALAMIGLPGDRVVGSPCRDFLGDDPSDEFSADGQGADARHGVEREVVRGDGSRLAVLRSVTRLDLGGHPHFMVSFVDLTDRKRMEGDLTEAATRLVGTRAILMTSIGRSTITDRLRESGLAHCLTKPVKRGLLAEVMTRVLAERSPSPTSPVTPVVPPRPGSPGARLLLVEDNAVNQKVTLRQLQKLGYRADAVGNGMEAVVVLRTIPYDLVLMDCQMPEMDGYEATRRVRDMEERRREQMSRMEPDRPHPETRRTPIVAITAHAMPGDREKCLAAGMDDYISKPVRLEDLKDVLFRWLGAADVAKKEGA